MINSMASNPMKTVVKKQPQPSYAGILPRTHLGDIYEKVSAFIVTKSCLCTMGDVCFILQFHWWWIIDLVVSLNGGPGSKIVWHVKPLIITFVRAYINVSSIEFGDNPILGVFCFLNTRVISTYKYWIPFGWFFRGLGFAMSLKGICTVLEKWIHFIKF